MKTVKTYLVRKPSDLEEVMELTKRYGNEAIEVRGWLDYSDIPRR